MQAKHFHFRIAWLGEKPKKPKRKDENFFQGHAHILASEQFVLLGLA